MITDQISDFPKLHSPFKRENIDGNYVVTPKINSGFEWVFKDTDNVKAVEKLHGSNVSVVIEDGEVVEGYTRVGKEDIQKVDPYKPQHSRIAEGIAKAVRLNYFDGYSDGQHFGEIIGEGFHGNPYDIKGHIFVPFKRLREKVHFYSYGDHPTTYGSISNWFKNDLNPLFYSKWHGLGFDEAEDQGFIEGVVFYHEKTGQMAKLRRDMFEWYEGGRH